MHQGALGQTAQWFFGFFMLFGWALNTSMAAYNHPRGTLAFIMLYSGVNALLIAAVVGEFFGSLGSLSYAILDHAAGAFTYRPLYMLYGAMDAFTLREMWIAGIVAAVCMAGFICGVLYRQVKPDPYRPTFIR